MTLTKTTYAMLQQAPVNVYDYGASGNGLIDDSLAFQLAINKAIETTGEVFVPAGVYLIENSIEIPFPGGIKITGVSNNSLGTRSSFLQKSIETPVFYVEGINVSMSGLSFTTWAGNNTELDETPITCVAVTSNSMTLSSNPWPNSAPLVWSLAAPAYATDGTAYNNCLQISIAGSFYASSVTINGNGTVTLNNVKGANGTLNASLASTLNQNVEAFVSLAQFATPPTNPQAGAIYLSVKENHFYQNLWFNQVTSPFTISALGSGAGVGIGVGNIGFMSDIVCDGAVYFIKALGDINNLQCVNCQFFGMISAAFYAPFGSVTSSVFTNNQVIIGKFMQCNDDIYGCIIVGNNFNAIDGYGYSDYLINVNGTISSTNITGNNFGRSTDTVINTSNILGSIITANNITSVDEGGSQPWLSVASNVTNSYLGGNNFADLYGSIQNRLGFASLTPSVTGSSFGGDFIGYQSGTKVIGWLDVVFQNSWTNVGLGTQSVQYFKDLNGIVYIKGECVGGASGSIVFTLPTGYRPNGILKVFGRANTSGGEIPMPVDVNTAGEVIIYASVVSWADFGMIMFPTR